MPFTLREGEDEPVEMGMPWQRTAKWLAGGVVVAGLLIVSYPSDSYQNFAKAAIAIIASWSVPRQVKYYVTNERVVRQFYGRVRSMDFKDIKEAVPGAASVRLVPHDGVAWNVPTIDPAAFVDHVRSAQPATSTTTLESSGPTA